MTQSAIAWTPSRHARATEGSARSITSSMMATLAIGSESPGSIRIRATAAISAALRAKAPTVSRVGESGIAPVTGTKPYVGFQAVTPQQCAGMRREPPVSDPSATTTDPLATAAAEPDEEPPLIKSRFHGLRTEPCTAL